MHGRVTIDDQTCVVESATLELFNLFSRRPDWVLDVRLGGDVPRLWLAGTGEPAPYRSPRRLDIHYVDAPAHHVALAPAELTAAELGAGRARVDGRFTMRDGARERVVEIALVAALVT